MTRRARSFGAAATALAAADPVVAGLVQRFGPPALRPPQETAFAALARSVLYQQLAGKAAATIHGRFVDLVGGSVTPEAVLALPEGALRAAGVSGAKEASIRDLAARVAAGSVDLAHVSTLDDDQLVAQLVAVRGIGRWTAEMFLLFQLRRLDVWPTGDLGVRKGFGVAWGLPATPAPKELEALGEPFRPYRSVVAWYCWRVLDGPG